MAPAGFVEITSLLPTLILECLIQIPHATPKLRIT